MMATPFFSLKFEGLEQEKSRLTDVARRQIPIATAVALTRTAKIGQAILTTQIARALNAPTEYATNSIYVQAATKTRLEAMLYVKTYGRVSTGKRKKRGKGQAEVLGHLFEGGPRIEKGFEYRLRKFVGVLPMGWAAVPGEGAPLDAHGNIPRGFLVQMLSYLRGLSSRYDWMSDKGKVRFAKKIGKQAAGKVEYFISRGKGNWFGQRSWMHGRTQTLPPGIWMRVSYAGGGTAVKPIIMFVKQPTYRHYFDIEQIVSGAMAKDFRREFDDALAEAVRTAR